MVEEKKAATVDDLITAAFYLGSMVGTLAAAQGGPVDKQKIWMLGKKMLGLLREGQEE